VTPQLFVVISKRRIKQRTVKEALNNRAWITDIQGAITVGIMLDFLQLWDILSDIVVQPETYWEVFFKWPIFIQGGI